MLLVERHIVTKQDQRWKQLDHLCFLSKNLYNAALYTIKQEFLKSGKWIRYNEMDKLMKVLYPQDYFILSSCIAQKILQILDLNLKAYFQAIKSWKRSNKKFTGCPQFPKYKDKIKGRNLIILTYRAAIHKQSFIRFPLKMNFPNLVTKTESLQEVRIFPQNSCYVIEVCYRKEEKVKETINSNWLSIDLGVNNLCTITSNIDKNIIINGKPIKSINQYFNKKKVLLQSSAKKNHNLNTTNRIKSLYLKRQNKINDYLHKTSKYIIDFCKENNIDNIVIGKNQGWKQECNLGSKNNQNFVQIPFENLIQKITYKAQLEGINIQIIEESYTSKCSALDLEPIQKQDIYKGKRVKRGLFETSLGKYINADINGSLNILRKVAGDDFILSCRGLAVSPVKINLN